MNIERHIIVELTSDEISNIIKEYLKREGIVIDVVDFNVITEYSSPMDNIGTEIFKGAKCKGKIKNEQN